VVVSKGKFPWRAYANHVRPKAPILLLVMPADDQDVNDVKDVKDVHPEGCHCCACDFARDYEDPYNYELDDFNYDCAREHAAFHGTRGRD